MEEIERDFDKQNLSNIVLGVTGVFTFCFFVCACTVANTANQGFNVVLTALCYIAQVAGGWYVTNKVQTSMAIGGLIGSTFTLAFLSLTQSIYWGQLTTCDTHYNAIIDQYTCDNTSAYKAVCAFAVLLFIAQGAFCAILTVWKEDFTLDPEMRGYDDLNRGRLSSDPDYTPGTFSNAGLGAAGIGVGGDHAYDAGVSYKPAAADL